MINAVKWIFGTLLVSLAWFGLLLFGVFYGWFREPLAEQENPGEFMSKAILYATESKPANVAFVLIENGQVFDTYYSEGIDAETLFPLASMSKWFTAYGILKLVQDGEIDLDAPVANYLTRWHLPDSEFDNDAVTTRLLLSHTAGLTDGLGFGDYQGTESIPTLEESLANPRASSGLPVSISLGREPGTEWEYSGGGYLILELLIEEVSQMSFADYMQQEIFNPLGMKRSTYDYLGSLTNAVQSQSENGEHTPHYRYAASAATGLSASASDLILFSQSQMGFGLSQHQASVQMRKPHAYLAGMPIWGLGTILYTSTHNGKHIFGHAGENDPAINTDVRLNPETGDGIIVLVTGNPSLAIRLGFLWTFWQTGRTDFVALESEIRRLFPWFAAGALVILLSGFVGWRRK